MRVLLVGSGAREHALAWKLSQSPNLDRLLLLPGNPGMDGLGDTIEGIDPIDVGAVAMVAAAQGIDLAVIGPEAPLAAGVTDVLQRAGVPTFGPTRAAARLESSKSFAKDVMHRAAVPTASAETFRAPDDAHAFLDRTAGPYVVKADGLAAGKGVLVTDQRAEAHSWVDRCLEGAFGDAGRAVVIEEFLDGPELSVFAICDGTNHLTLQPARDFKRLGDGDAGPNTGGMGAYSPVAVSPDVLAVADQIIAPTLRVMGDDGHPFIGFLYVGLALTAAGPKVIEFNCRLGDPETQVVLPRLASDLLPALAAAAQGSLPASPLEWHPDTAVNVVLAAHGYPESPRSGDVITGAEQPGDDGLLVFHAGTRREGTRLQTAGGRVLSVVGLGHDLAAARAKAYAGVERIRFPGMHFRSDIARG